MTSEKIAIVDQAQGGMSPLEELVARRQRERDRSWTVKLSRWWSILRYYRFSQLLRRAISVLGRRLGVQSDRIQSLDLSETPRVRSTSFDKFRLLAEVRAKHCYVNAEFRRNELRSGRVTLLNVQRPIAWTHEANIPLLWQFQLQYHEYLLPFANAIDEGDIGLVEQVLRSWLRSNSPTDPGVQGSAWHPYCISRRLPVWFNLIANLPLDANLREDLTKSAYLQAKHLSHHLEFGLGGNHLIENLRALALSSVFFDTAEAKRWMSEVDRFLPAELAEQTLEHGEHFERSPMYHCQVLGDAMEVAIALREINPILHQTLQMRAEQMMEFLQYVLHPDGEIPLFGDSCFGEAPSAVCLTELHANLASKSSHEAHKSIAFSASEPRSDNHPIAKVHGPYWRFRGDSLHLLFDRGPVGADRLPAHAHGDLLGIEVSVNGRRFIVDSGVFNYDDDSMRWFCRSTNAHNVIAVEDHEQCEVWSKFRMGYRGKTLDLNAGESDDYYWSSASHDAYRRLGMDRVARLVVVSRDERLLCLDRTRGAEGKSCIGRLHLAPDVQVECVSESTYRLQLGNEINILQFYGTTKVNSTWGWYCSKFGSREQRTVLEYQFEASDEQIFGWQLSCVRSEKDPNSVLDSSLRFGVELEGDRLLLREPRERKQVTLSWPL